MIKLVPLKKEIEAEVEAPPSKAHSLRAFFVGALAENETLINNPLLAEDQKYAIDAMSKFGADFEIKKDKVEIRGTGGKLKTPAEKVFIGNSGVTARFLASFASLMKKGEVLIDGTERMRTGRPIKDLLVALNQLGVEIESISKNGLLPIRVKGGGIKGGTAELSGKVSSQYFSSLLISAPYADKDVKIKCIGNISSKPYINITLDVMDDFGVKAENRDFKEFYIKSGQRYKGRSYRIEGDYSNASYFLALPAMFGGKMKVSNLKLNSSQGDKIFPDILEKMNCDVLKKEKAIEIKRNKKLQPIEIDMNPYPDLVPTLAVVASFAAGETRIKNIGQLRFKECDRISAVATELGKVGVETEEKEAELIVKGNPNGIHGAEIDCYNDHRIAMAFSILGVKLEGVIIKNEKCVKKSFVDFYDVLKEVGVEIEKIN